MNAPTYHGERTKLRLKNEKRQSRYSQLEIEEQRHTQRSTKAHLHLHFN
jgi:hypothetical protein